MSLSSRNWCFTLNNYTEAELESILKIDGLTYVVCGREVGEQGTPHIQGFIIHNNKVTLGKMKKLIPRAHFDMARGTAVQAMVYCKKDGNYTEVGQAPLAPGESKKRQWDEIVNLAKAGQYEELIDKHPGMYLRYHKGLKAMRLEFKQPTQSIEKLDNYWYYGLSGSGKSRRAREENPGAYIKMANKWWDDYSGQDTVIIEDWSPDHVNLVNDLKLWTDHHATRVESKHGGFMIRPKRVIITSQYTIEECFSRCRDSDAITRRFKVVNF